MRYLDIGGRDQQLTLDLERIKKQRTLIVRSGIMPVGNPPACSRQAPRSETPLCLARMQRLNRNTLCKQAGIKDDGTPGSGYYSQI